MGNFVGSGVQSRGEKERQVIPYLPYDILINILSRLPPYDVIRFRCVCRGWLDLISSQDFLGIHLTNKRVTDPSIFVVNMWRLGMPYFIDTWWEPIETRRNLWMFPKEYLVRLSLGGLIVLGQPFNSRKWIILNPINNDSLRIEFLGDAAQRWKDHDVYGVFFHPLLKEYCTLWGARGTKLVKFMLLVMGSTPYYSEIGNPLGARRKESGTVPILMNDHLYWMAWREFNQKHYDIVEFDINSGEFMVIPSPVLIEFSSFRDVGILDIDGLVSLVKTCNRKKLVTIWTLKDPPGRLWTSSSYNITRGTRCPRYHSLRPVAFAKGDIFLDSSEKLFVYNLKSERLTSFQRYFGARTFCHVMTLASLRNGKSQIGASEIIEETSGGQIQIIWERTEFKIKKAPVTDNSLTVIMRGIAHILSAFCNHLY